MITSVITVHSLLNGISNIIEWVSVIILIIGFAKALTAFVSYEYKSMIIRSDVQNITSVRPLLAKYILLGLDFYIISDIISSMIKEDLNDLLSLIVIVALRTTIGYFLSKEVVELNSEVK